MAKQPKRPEEPDIPIPNIPKDPSVTIISTVNIEPSGQERVEPFIVKLLEILNQKHVLDVPTAQLILVSFGKNLEHSFYKVF